MFAKPGNQESLERGKTLTPNFDANGLIAAIAQHAETGEVLMIGFMNADALQLTLEVGEAHYFSRSRQEIWHKGDTSS